MVTFVSITIFPPFYFFRFPSCIDPTKLERPNVTLKYFASQITLSYCFVNIINVHTQCGVQFLNAQKRFTPIHIIPLMVFLAIYRLLSSISSILNISQYFIKKKILNFEERQIIILINNFLLLYSVKKNLTSINPI